jgi:hypothetical protein
MSMPIIRSGLMTDARSGYRNRRGNGPKSKSQVQQLKVFARQAPPVNAFYKLSAIRQTSDRKKPSLCEERFLKGLLVKR